MPATIVGPVVPQSLPASPTLLSVDIILSVLLEWPSNKVAELLAWNVELTNK
jgi:hypothetical protein